jgi:hypothetical protein
MKQLRYSTEFLLSGMRKNHSIQVFICLRAGLISSQSVAVNTNKNNSKTQTRTKQKQTKN